MQSIVKGDISLCFSLRISICASSRISVIPGRFSLQYLVSMIILKIHYVYYAEANSFLCILTYMSISQMVYITSSG